MIEALWVGVAVLALTDVLDGSLAVARFVWRRVASWQLANACKSSGKSS